jgi:signal transduction histidine kinase
VKARAEAYARREQDPRHDFAVRPQVEEQVRRSVDSAHALLRVAARLNQHIDLQILLDAICEEAVGVLQLPVAAIALYEDKKEQFRLAASQGLPQTFSQQAPPLPLAWFREQTGEVHEPFLVPDLREAEQAPLTHLMLAFEFRTIAFVELYFRRRLVGLLLVSSLSETRNVDDEALGLLGGLADQAAQAIAHARLFKTLRALLQRTQRQSARQQRIMDAVPEGLMLLDDERRVLLANPAGRRMLANLVPGHKRDAPLDQIGGLSLAPLLDELASSKGWAEVETAAAPVAHHSDGAETLLFELTVRAIEDEADEARWILVIRDVTGERQRREVAQSQDRLATVGQLAAGIAHDFNNIMAIITLYSQTLERNPDFPKRKEYLATISEQAQHASDLIVQILDFSRRTVMERGRLDLLPFTKEMVKLLRRTLPENISVALQAEPGNYLVDADPTRLRQGLMNLALNARDAMPQGGDLQIALSSVTFQSRKQLPVRGMSPGSYMCLSVADTGVGVDAEVLPHLFEPFFTTKDTGKGTGMGLAQVHGIVKQHGGEIEVDSSPGNGARFTLYLPALETRTAPEPADQVTLAVDAAGATVLLVEDHDPTREAIGDTLELLGYNVLVATTGREALSLFDAHAGKIDIVLSDMVMPEMGGVELYRNLMARNADLKMLVMTGYPLEHEGRSLLEQGIVDWIHKPFSPELLASKLAGVLGRDGD